MKAVTLRQPWPWALLEGGCPTLTIAATTAARALEGHTGPLALCASETLDPVEHHGRIDLITGNTRPVTGAPKKVAADAGGYVGIVDLTGNAHHSDDCQGVCGEWGFLPGWHYEVTNPRTLNQKVPAGVGRSGIHTVDRATEYLISLGERA